MTNLLRRAVILCAAIGALSAATAAHQTAEPLGSLGAAVEAFLVEWMRGTPAAAADRYTSGVTLKAPQVLPSSGTDGTLPPQPAGAKPQQPMTNELESIRASVRSSVRDGTILEPTRSAAAIPEIQTIVQDLGLELQALDRPPVLAYRVRNWKDIAWCGSVGPRHRAVLVPEISAGAPIYGVVGRLRSSTPAGWTPVLMLWRLEAGAAGTSAWKVVTILPIQTN